jgi:hypothetical protein
MSPLLLLPLLLIGMVFVRVSEADSSVNCCWQSPTSEGGFHRDTHTTHDVSLQMKFTPRSALCVLHHGATFSATCRNTNLWKTKVNLHYT